MERGRAAERMSVPEGHARSAPAPTVPAPRSAKLLGRAAGQPRPRQRTGALARGALGGGGRRDRNLGRRWRLGAEDLFLRLALEQRLELLLLDRLALDEDLRELLQIRPVACQDLLGLNVCGPDDPPD